MLENSNTFSEFLLEPATKGFVMFYCLGLSTFIIISIAIANIINKINKKPEKWVKCEVEEYR